MSSETKLRSRPIDRRALAAAAGLAILLGGIALYPFAAPPSLAEQRAEYAAKYAQDFQLPASLNVTAESTPMPTRDAFGSTPGPETFIASGTNHDWAKLVLLYAGWPISDNNVTVITRWMRQENYVDAWWTRNNPLNIGMGGFASYPSLQESARVVAKALSTSGGYREIAAAFAASADPAVTENAIWASPWAGGHYAWGAHWHYSDVEVVTAPSGAWGR